jgi:hypothetical protein
MFRLPPPAAPGFALPPPAAPGFALPPPAAPGFALPPPAAPGFALPPQDDGFERGLPNILRRPPANRKKAVSESFIPANGPLPDLPLDVQREIFKSGAHQGFTTSKGLYRTRDQSVCWDPLSLDDFDRWVESVPVGSSQQCNMAIIYSVTQSNLYSIKFNVKNNWIEVTMYKNGILSDRVSVERASSVFDVALKNHYYEEPIKCVIFDRVTTEEIVSLRHSCGDLTYTINYYQKMVDAARYFMGYKKVMAAFLLVSLHPYRDMLSDNTVLDTLADYITNGANGKEPGLTDMLTILYNDLLTLSGL